MCSQPLSVHCEYPMYALCKLRHFPALHNDIFSRTDREGALTEKHRNSTRYNTSTRKTTAGARFMHIAYYHTIFVRILFLFAGWITECWLEVRLHPARARRLPRPLHSKLQVERGAIQRWNPVHHLLGSRRCVLSPLLWYIGAIFSPIVWSLRAIRPSA